MVYSIFSNKAKKSCIEVTLTNTNRTWVLSDKGAQKANTGGEACTLYSGWMNVVYKAQRPMPIYKRSSNSWKLYLLVSSNYHYGSESLLSHFSHIIVHFMGWLHLQNLPWKYPGTQSNPATFMVSSHIFQSPFKAGFEQKVSKSLCFQSKIYSKKSAMFIENGLKEMKFGLKTWLKTYKQTRKNPDFV